MALKIESRIPVFDPWVLGQLVNASAPASAPLHVWQVQSQNDEDEAHGGNRKKAFPAKNFKRDYRTVTNGEDAWLFSWAELLIILYTVPSRLLY